MCVHCFSPVPLFGHKTFGGNLWEGTMAQTYCRRRQALGSHAA